MAAVVAVCTGAGMLLVMDSSGRADAQNSQSNADAAALDAATTLSREPALFITAPDGTVTDIVATGIEYDIDTVEQAARRIAAEIPFPPGLNSASHLNWPAVLDGGLGGTAIEDADLRSVIQANALRDWAWYAANNPLSDEQRRIVQSIRSWSGFRGQAGNTPVLAQRAMELGQTPEGRAFAARLFGESNGKPRPTRW